MFIISIVLAAFISSNDFDHGLPLFINRVVKRASILQHLGGPHRGVMELWLEPSPVCPHSASPGTQVCGWASPLLPVVLVMLPGHSRHQVNNARLYVVSR